jgi:hypothetical protein
MVMTNEVTSILLFPLEEVQERNEKAGDLSFCGIQRIKTGEQIDLAQVPYFRLRKKKIKNVGTIGDLDEFTRVRFE